MIFKVARVELADRPAAGRLARLVNTLAVAADEIMPFAQRLVRRPRPVPASLRERVEPVEIGGVEADAVADSLHAVGIIEAEAVPAVEQLASDVGRVEQAGLLVLKLVQAATPAAVAQRLPL